MSEQRIRELFESARLETSAKAATLTFVAGDGQDWTLLVRGPDTEEMAILVKGSPDQEESLKEQIRRELMRLF